MTELEKRAIASGYCRGAMGEGTGGCRVLQAVAT